jgi:hypothetical protein
MHQDIAPRNLLIDPATNKILLFDFDRASPISEAVPARNNIENVIFTLYELLTGDVHFRDILFLEQDPEQGQSLQEWLVRCETDQDVSKFRGHLND